MKVLKHARRTGLLGFACASVAWAAVWSATAANVACPLKHGQWEPFPALTDEFDSETFADWFGLPQNDALPATFSIDYIRAWKRKDGPLDDRPEAVEFAFPGRTSATEAGYRLKVDVGETLVVKAAGGAERPDRVHVQYLDDAFFASQQAAEIQRKLTLHDKDGKVLTILMTWSRTEPWKREGRERAGEAPGSPTLPTNGYHAVGVDVRPLAAKPRGTVEGYEFRTESGSPIQITVRH